MATNTAGTTGNAPASGSAQATPLDQRRCVPCEGGCAALTPEQIAPLLSQVPGWRVEDGGPGAPSKLVRSYRFDNFVHAVDFVNAITPIAEAEGHHPDLFVRWGEVRVELWTHAAGGLTENDFILAAKIDARDK